MELMNLNDNQIRTAPSRVLFSPDFIFSLLNIDAPEEQARMEALSTVRAQELGVKSEFKKALSAFHAAEKELQARYRQEYNERTGLNLEVDSNGNPAATIDNFLQIIETDEKFSGLKFNLLTYSPEQIREGKACRWLDADDAEARRYIEKKYKIHNQQKCDDAFRIVFAKNEYHPIRDLIDSVEWDGVPRIKTMLHKWTKCEDTEYTQEVSRLIFAGGINRLYRPGCKFDDMPVLIGTRQGEGKSSFIRMLALKDEYFTEVTEFDGQRGIESLEGAWICEVSELLAMTRQKEQEAVKSFLTRMNDRYRMPYDKRVNDHFRQCIFIGTTNKEQFLTDKTGNRRFYPVKVNQNGYELFKHKDEIHADALQCWAEAKAKIDTDEMRPYADQNLSAVIKNMQADATEDDYRVGMIEEYLENQDEVCVLEIWQKALDMGEFSKPTRKDSSEIVLIMQNFKNWQKQDKAKRFKEFGVQKWWKKEEILEDLPFD